MGIITGRRSELVARRASELGIDPLIQGSDNKAKALKAILDNTGLTASEIAYMGDDSPDLPVLLQVGLSASVPQGHPDTRNEAHVVTGTSGGFGAVRELTDFILKAQGRYNEPGSQ